MPFRGFTPVLLCLLPIWRILEPVSIHPQHNRCLLMRKTALCNNGRLSSVPTDLPDDVKELQLNYNQIKTLEDNAFLRYPALTSLSLACNSLERLESNTFHNATLLESLNLASNKLYTDYRQSSLALRTLPRLKTLDLSENQLNDDVAFVLLNNLTFLEYLNLSGNLLKRLDEDSFRHLHRLKDLDLQRNAIFEIDDAFGGLSNLQRLNLAFNYLPCLTGFHMTQLVVLNASYNSIEWFASKQELNETFQLRTLDLSNNKLLFFPLLPSRSRLQNLYLSHNAVRFYEHLTDNVVFYNLRNHTENVTADLWDDALHGDVSSVEILDLRANLVEHFPQRFMQKMPVLSRLRVGANCLQTLNLTSQVSENLYELDVSDNKLKEIVADDASLQKLTYFNLSLNNLNQLPFGLFSSLPSIASVDLSYNDVMVCLSADADVRSVPACVDWRNIASLRQLYLRGCKLKKIPAFAFAGSRLTHLELSDNPGLVVRNALEPLSRTLQHLGLGNTQIQDVNLFLFQSLKFLNLSKNSLPNLPASLDHLDLRVLDLSENRLSSIPSGRAHQLAAKLQTIFLAGNPFDCCRADWFGIFERANPNLIGPTEIACQDLNAEFYTLGNARRVFCGTEGESKLWYILLFIPVTVLFLAIAVVFILSFRPKKLQKSIKKKYLKPTSY